MRPVEKQIQFLLKMLEVRRRVSYLGTWLDMKTENYECGVLGLGGMGSATLYSLARRGVRVCGIEQFGIAHDRGSSHGETRIIRKAYFEHPDYVPLLSRSYELWQELERESEQKLFVQCPLICAGKADAEVIKGLELCYQRYELPHQRLRAPDARKRYPQFRFPDDFVVYQDPVAGFLYVEKCIAAHIKLATKLGAKVYSDERVVAWREEGKGVRITTDGREIVCENLIITAGPWAVRQLASLKLPLQVWRRVVFWYDSANLSDYAQDLFPIFYVECQGGGFYGFPVINEFGLKVAEHVKPQPITDPDSVNRELLRDDEPPILSFLGECLPQFQPRRVKYSVCLYTMTPDGHFIIDHHPLHPNVVFAAGFSGHGFKFATVVGEILSDLALQGKTALPIKFLRLGRLL